MNFFPVELTVDEMIYIDEIVDDILQDSNHPSDTVISFLRNRVNYPVHTHVNTNVNTNVSTQPTLQKYNRLSIPSLLFLHTFVLE